MTVIYRRLAYLHVSSSIQRQSRTNGKHEKIRRTQRKEREKNKGKKRAEVFRRKIEENKLTKKGYKRKSEKNAKKRQRTNRTYTYETPADMPIGCHAHVPAYLRFVAIPTTRPPHKVNHGKLLCRARRARGCRRCPVRRSRLLRGRCRG